MTDSAERLDLDALEKLASWANHCPPHQREEADEEFQWRFDAPTVLSLIARIRELEGRAPAEAGAPSGWKLVPVEPTEEMLKEIDLMEGFSSQALRVRYAAMLAAVPAAPKD